jgi:hypothetical protein
MIDVIVDLVQEPSLLQTGIGMKDRRKRMDVALKDLRKEMDVALKDLHAENLMMKLTKLSLVNGMIKLMILKNLLAWQVQENRRAIEMMMKT